MTLVRVSTQDLFDGLHWRGPATVVVDGDRISDVRLGGAADDCDVAGTALMPGLIDFGVTANGYIESPMANHPFAPEAAFAALCLRFGVTTVIDVNNSATVLAYLRGMHEKAAGPRVIASGARLSTSPSSRSDMLIDRVTALEMLEANRLAGGELVSIGTITDGELEGDLRRRAGELGVVVVAGADATCEVPGLAFEVPGATRDARFLAPQLEAVARWTVDGLLRARDAAMAAPFLPYSRNFARTEGFVGRRIGRGILARYYGNRDPVSMEVCERAAVQAAGLQRCLASSGAGAPGLVPGRSMWAELGRLQRAGIDPDDVLFSATGVAETLLGESGLGRVEPGARADLLVLGEPARGRDPADLWTALTHVVLVGRVIATTQLAGEVDKLIAEAMKEPV